MSSFTPLLDGVLPVPRTPAGEAASRSVAMGPLGSLVAVYLLLGAAVRVLLWLAFGRHAGVSASAMPAVFVLGTVNDLVAALYLLLPLSLLIAASPASPTRARRLLATAVWLSLVAMLGISSIEYFWFEAFGARFRADILQGGNQIWPGLQWLRQVYPAMPLLALIAAASGALGWLLWPSICLASRAAAVRPVWRYRVLAAHLALIAAANLAWSADRLHRFDNPCANALADSGLSQLFGAAGNRVRVDIAVR